MQQTIVVTYVLIYLPGRRAMSKAAATPGISRPLVNGERYSRGTLASS